MRTTERSQTEFVYHNALMGSAIIVYSLFVGPAISPYNHSTPVERMYGVNYLRDVVHVNAAYFWIQSAFSLLNYMDAALLLTTTLGFLRKRDWAPALTYFWSTCTITLAVLAVLVHYFFVAAPEYQMLRHPPCQ